MSSSRRKKGTSSSSSETGIDQIGLRQSVQKRLVSDVFEQASATHPGWKILIVDEPSMKVISAAVGMYDIMERKVTLVESLEKKRAPFPDMGAIYILAPVQESVDLLVDDFASKSKLLYGTDIFVYFLGRIPEPMLDQIKKCKQLVKRLKALSEINVYFLSKEERAFMLDMRANFRQFYLRNSPSPKEVSIAEQLVTVCATLNEYPYVRYRQSSGIASSLASLFHLKMEEFVAANPDWWFHGSGKSENKLMERDRSSILLLDRANDCLTPLMHDFTYQAMVQDLLNVEGDKITYKAESADDPDVKEDKDVLLNDKDKLWCEIRGKHIAQVIEMLSTRIQNVVNSSTGSALGGKSDGQMSLSQMASALKELPEYREIMSKLSQHMNIAHECMDVFKRDGLMDLSDVEQTLATGQDEDGRSPKIAEMVSQVENAMMRMTDSQARLRMLLIATVSQDGLQAADRDRLSRAANLSSEETQTLNNLEQMGVSTVSTPSSSGKMGFFGGVMGKIAATNSFDEESEYASSRYVPPLKAILTELVSNSLSIDEYPSVVPMPTLPKSTGSASSARRRGAEGSARKNKGAGSKFSKAGGAGQGSATNFTGGRNIVFMIGGLSFSELRVARELMEKESREIVIGSTAFVSPQHFMEDLASLTS